MFRFISKNGWTPFSNNTKLKFLIIHGPNLNLLGERTPEQYGTESLKCLNRFIRLTAQLFHLKIRIVQSNHEGKLIDIIHKYRSWADGIIINPGALTHYSYALHDALEAVSIPVIEVHLSDISKREDFRKISVVKPACIDQIGGLGFEGYREGLKRLKAYVSDCIK
jgi:3-dehydroquinate dehydratase-2